MENVGLLSQTEQEGARSRIIVAAQETFSIVGFEGASLRQMAQRAEVQHQLLIYHFKNKETLWKVAITAIFEDLNDRFQRRVEGLDGVEAGTVLRLMIRDFVQFSASHPEFHRIMTIEGRADNPRMRWLLETHIRPYYNLLTRLIQEAQQSGGARAGDAGQLYYALLGLITTAFSLAPEVQLMSGADPFSAEYVAAIVGLACDFIFPGKK